MFVQIHMLQSMPPGNLNRDDTGQPKKCIFGRVTRARISSQCLKRNIRQSTQFMEVFGDALADRTTYLPRMVADELKILRADISEDDLNKIKSSFASKFKAEKRGGSDSAEEDRSQSDSAPISATDQTGQLVFFPPPFAKEVAKLVVEFMSNQARAYKAWINGTKKDRDEFRNDIARFEGEVFKASRSLTVDIGMFGRMTTSDLVVNVEAACQVAHAISTHEAFIESDWFTAMDDKKAEFASTQTELAGAGFIGSGESETFFDSAVYYKYLNLDVDALKKHLSWQNDAVARAVAALVRAAAIANPTGKQNSFAAHGVPELILVELSKAKSPISYANAFLKAVEGPDLMAESAKALSTYLETVARAFAPADMRRLLLAVGSAAIEIGGSIRADTLDALIDSVAEFVKRGDAA
ncbi:MAG: type I-E CRISPR-associated protein Cas7/Cse4/CasC [Terriglobia bacterium]